MQWIRHAFAVGPPGPVKASVDERRLVDRLCLEIVRRGMATPALLALECSHPLNFIGSQFLLLAAPIAELIFPRRDYRTLTGFLERRGSVEYVCRRLEWLAGRQGRGSSGARNRATRPAD